MMPEFADHEVPWSDVPYIQPMTRDAEGRPICAACAMGKHPHGGSPTSDCKVLFDWYVGKTTDQRLKLCEEYKVGGQCCCVWRLSR